MTLWFCFGVFKGPCIIINQNNMGTWFGDIVIIYSGSLKRLSIIVTQQNMGPWCSDTLIFFWLFQTTKHLSQHKRLNQHVIWVWVGYRFIFNNYRRFVVWRKYFYRMCLWSEWFFPSDFSVFIQLVVTLWRGWRCWRIISGVFKLLFVLFSEFVSSANSIVRGWWDMIYCCRFWNYDILLIIFDIVRFLKINKYLIDVRIYFLLYPY